MFATTTPRGGAPALPDPQSAVRHWVEALVGGHCTEGDFISQVLLLTDEDADAAWEVLALLDQFNRRRQLGEDVFKRMKLRLQQECLGYGDESVAAPPMPPPPAQPEAEPVQTQPRRGDLLKGRYRVTQIQWHSRTGTFLI